MSTLTGRTVATTYKDLLQISNQNSGIDGQYRYIEDGEGTISVLGLSTDGIQINGHVQPASTETFDLGSTTNRFRDLYLSGNTIYLGDKTITSDDVQAVKDVQTTNLPVSSIAELASTSVQPGDAISFSTLINRPTTLDGYGITDAATAADMVEANDAIDTFLAPLYTDVNAASADWNDTRTTVSNNSGDWFSPPELTNLLQTSSGTWNTATQPDTNVQFDNLTVTGHIAGPATLTIDPAAVGDNTGRVVIAGDLQVDGVTTTVNSTVMTVSGKTITLAEGATDPSMTDQSGIHVDHVDANILYDSTTDTWNTNRDLNVTGTVDASVDLTVQGDSVVTQSDIGTQSNQIPQNKDLGSLAYMNQIDLNDVQVDDLVLREMVADKQDVDNITHIHVYDTRKDSDGGAWRERVSQTSWYNETLGTDVRGTRRDFPCIAVFVVSSEGGEHRRSVTIYDGDSPDLEMWMRFHVMKSNYAQGGCMLGGSVGGADETGYGTTGRAVAARNGEFWFGRCGAYLDSDNYGALNWVNFITDNGGSLRPSGWADNTQTNGQMFQSSEYTGNIANRNNPVLNIDSDGAAVYPHTGNHRQHKYWNEGGLLSNNIVDLEIAVLDGAPVNPDTKLPIPTIAVATISGMCILRDNRSIISVQHSTEYGFTMRCKIDPKRREVVVSHNGPTSGQCIEVFEIERLQNAGSGEVGPIHGTHHNYLQTYQVDRESRWYGFTNSESYKRDYRNAGGLFDLPSFGQAINIEKLDNTILFGQYYLGRIDENVTRPERGMLNITRESFNTGWMVGDTRANVMCDLQTGTIGQQEGVSIVQNSSFASNFEPWVIVQPTDNGWYYDEPNNIMRFTQASDSSVGLLYQDVDVLPGFVYQIYGQANNQNVHYKVLPLQDDGTEDPNLDIILDSFGTVSGEVKEIFRPTTSRVRIQCEVSSSSATVDYLSVQLVSNMTQPELEWSGTRQGTVTGSLRGWTDPLMITASSGGMSWSGGIATLSNLVVGKQYIVTVKAGQVLTPTGGGGGNWHMLKTSDSEGAHSDAVWSNSDIDKCWSYISDLERFVDSATHRLIFTARYATEYIAIEAQSSSSGDGTDNSRFVIESFDIRETVEDRCARVSNPRDGGRGFSLHGQLQRTPVADGAELVGYSGFDEYNFISQPYNSSYDFSDEFCIMGWFKCDDNDPANQGHLLNIFEHVNQINDGAGGLGHNFIRVIVDGNPRIYCQVGDGVTGTNDSTWYGSTNHDSGYYLPTTWTHICFVRDINGNRMYINGRNMAGDERLHAGTNAAALPQFGSSAVAYLGNSPHSGGSKEFQGTTPFKGSMALWKIGRHAATDSQIEKIYTQEHRMFQPGAQVALLDYQGDPYKGYVHLTDMCVDQDTEQIHVATGLGRSSFQDLIRVDQTTNSTNRVGAANGLIIEG